MELFIEIPRALLMATAPIGLFSFTLVWWALRGGHFKESLDISALEGEMKAMAKAHKKKKDNKENNKENAPSHPIQKKWASFGGGFYGIVAFFTYTVIEVQDVVSTIMDFGGVGDFIRSLSFGLLIDMFLEALFNFIAAVTWPVYWLSNIDTTYVWVWFLAAYLGYWLGLRLAQRVHRSRQES